MAENSGTAMVRAPDRAVRHAETHREKANVPGPAKAALWLLSADEDLASRTLGLMSLDDVRRIKETAERLGRISPEQLVEIHLDFHQTLQQSPPVGRAGVEYLGRLASRAFGESKAAGVFAPAPERRPQAAETLSRADVDALAAALAAEHPQISAAVLAGIAPKRSADILKRLRPEAQREILERMARLSAVPHAALVEAELALGAGLPAAEETGEKLDGVRAAALLLNQLVPNDAEQILAAMNEDAKDTAVAIRRAMFTFDDLIKLDRRGWQTLLKEVQRDQLLPALKAASPEMREKIYSSMSKRAAEMLRDDLDVMGPVRVADTEVARQALVDVALRLRSEGSLNIGNVGEEVL
jgi:flagellar motor switch protein FliG